MKSKIKLKHHKILAVIPARGGSTRIKNKNIKLLNGKPLIYYTIRESLKSKYITDVCISSDSNKILDLASKFGINYLIKRAKHLSTNLIPSFPSILDALLKIEKIKKFQYDYILMLQPTSPFRTSLDIDTCLRKLTSSKIFDSAVSVVDVEGTHPLRMKKITSGKLVNYMNIKGENMQPRQKLEKVYIRNGALYAIRRNQFINLKSLVGEKVMPYIMPKDKSINIDDEIDFKFAKLNFK